jgi:hypothetical protein
MQILDLLGMYFDAVVAEVKTCLLLFKLALAILCHCLTELFSIYQYKHWTIRRRDDRFVHTSSHRIILKIVRFHEYKVTFLWLCDTVETTKIKSDDDII